MPIWCCWAFLPVGCCWPAASPMLSAASRAWTYRSANSTSPCTATTCAGKEIGRPRSVQLAVLIDRGHRQLPIQADHVGKQLPSPPEARVYVRMSEIDDADAVTISMPEE